MIKKYRRIEGLVLYAYPLECEAVLYTGKNDKEINEFTAFSLGNGISLNAGYYVLKKACPEAKRIYTMPPEEFELMYESDLDK